MKNAWIETLQNLLWFGIAGLAIGLLFGYPAWGLLVALTIYLCHFIYQLRRFDDWLAHYPTIQPPESSGLWGSVFDRLYRLQKNGQLTANDTLAALSKAQTAANMLSDGLISLDPNGKLQWWNNAAAMLLQLQSLKDQGQHITHLVRDPKFVAYFSQGSFNHPFELRQTHHDLPMLQIHVVLFGEQRLLLLRDISRLHHLQQVRTDFIANASHELRTPLTVLMGYLETFQDIPEFAAYQSGLSAMMLQAQRMHALIDDLLLLSRLEHQDNKRPLEVIDIGALLYDLKQEANMLSQQKQISIFLSNDENFCLLGSYSNLHSAFMNLITNAIKYSPDNTRIDLVTGVQQNGNRFVAIKDEGIGINPVLIPRLTERFFRIDTSRNSSTGGTGLGLAIVKHVMLQHQGRLEILSQLGKGSQFICVFPESCVTDCDSI